MTYDVSNLVLEVEGFVAEEALKAYDLAFLLVHFFPCVGRFEAVTIGAWQSVAEGKGGGEVRGRGWPLNDSPKYRIVWDRSHETGSCVSRHRVERDVAGL